MPRPVGGESLRPINRLATVVVALVCLTAVADLGISIALWNTFRVVQDYLGAAPTVSLGDLYLADGITLGNALPRTILLVVTGVLVIWWLRRARINAEVLSYVRHRHGRGWIIGGWFCPIVNFWYPKQIVDDIWRTSDPSLPPKTTGLDAAGPRSALVATWWWAWIGAEVVDGINSFATRGEPSVEMFRSIAIASTLYAILHIVAAVALVMVIRRITAWQTVRPEPAGRPPAHAPQPAVG